MKYVIPEKLNRILVIRRDNIGDLLCTTPLISALRQHFPDADISVLANSYNAPILVGNPDIDQLYAYTKAKHSDGSKLSAWWHEWQLFRQLKKQRFDLIIHANPTVHRRTAKLVNYLKGSAALGVDGGEGVYSIALTPDDIGGAHHVEQVFSLLQPLGISASPGPLTLVAETPYQANTPPVVGIHLSSRKPDNRWPEEHYRALIEALLTNGHHVRLFWAPGSQNDAQHPGDDELADRIKTGFGDGVTPISTHTLRQLVNALNQCDHVICPDGGTMHIAAALQKPLVALFGCTPADIWGPWGTRAVVLNGNGSASNISVQNVCDALAQLEQQGT